jgi:hypothetical protein
VSVPVAASRSVSNATATIVESGSSRVFSVIR